MSSIWFAASAFIAIATKLKAEQTRSNIRRFWQQITWRRLELSRHFCSEWIRIGNSFVINTLVFGILSTFSRTSHWTMFAVLTILRLWILDLPCRFFRWYLFSFSSDRTKFGVGIIDLVGHLIAQMHSKLYASIMSVIHPLTHWNWMHTSSTARDAFLRQTFLTFRSQMLVLRDWWIRVACTRRNRWLIAHRRWPWTEISCSSFNSTKAKYEKIKNKWTLDDR